jgi:hypothetical protein
MTNLSSHGEGGPFGIDSHESEKTEGRAVQVGNIKSRDGRILEVRR